jgi:hypothetical protein
MPRSSLRCTLAVLSRNVGRSRVARGQLPGHRQFADPPLEEAYLRPRQTSYGVGCDREPSRERGSRRLVPSTSTSNKVQATYCVGCRTRQKERKQRPRQQKDSNWPPQPLLLAQSVAQSATGAPIEGKRVKICLPVYFCPADLGCFSTANPACVAGDDRKTSDYSLLPAVIVLGYRFCPALVASGTSTSWPFFTS